MCVKKPSIQTSEAGEKGPDKPVHYGCPVQEDHRAASVCFLNKLFLFSPRSGSLTQTGRQSSRSESAEEDRVLGFEKYKEHRPMSLQVWDVVP